MIVGINTKLDGFSRIIENVSLPRTSTILLAFASPIPLNNPPDKNSTIESFSSGINLS